jgi:molybdopterin-binding protein
LKFKSIRRKKMKLSARNQLKGKIASIEEGAVNAIVKVDIGNGNIVTSSISMGAVKDLGLTVGSEATAVVKATSVMIMVD